MEREEAASKRARSSGGVGTVEPEEAEPKRARLSSSGGTSGGHLDRLSALPDRLIHAIMSFLKARQVVQTCLLSKRWRHLWLSVPCLDIDHNEFMAMAVASAPINHAPTDPDDGDYKEWDDFEDFAENLMRRCNIAQLDTLRVNVNRGRAPRFAENLAGGWLRHAMKYCTPDPLRQREGPSFCSWPMKRLYLCNVALDNRFANHLTSVCLSLEDLVLDDCTGEIRLISSCSLKSLVLKNCRWGNHPEIVSPTLESLVISGGTAEGFVLRVVAPKIVHLCLDVPLSFARHIYVNQAPLSRWSRRRSIHN